MDETEKGTNDDSIISSGKKNIVEDKNSYSFFKESIIFMRDVFVILLVVILIRKFLIVPFQINGQSMYDSYYNKEFIIVDKFSYLSIPSIKTGTPKRGDVVVFMPHVDKTKQYYIKRIIGLPGEKIKIVEGKVYLSPSGSNDFKEIKESYLSDTNRDSTFVSSESKEYIFEVPNESYFVMGDNRMFSTDSRTCFKSCSVEGNTNYIKKDAIVGKVLIDLGYFDAVRSYFPFQLGDFKFIHPELGISTSPRWFSSSSHFEY